MNSCLECHIERRDGLQPQWIVSLEAARDRELSLKTDDRYIIDDPVLPGYSQLCSNVAPTVSENTIEPATSPPANNASSSSPESAPSLSRRESSIQDDICVYGLPVITWKIPQDSQFSPFVNDRNIFIGILFTIAVVVCIVENRRHSS